MFANAPLSARMVVSRQEFERIAVMGPCANLETGLTIVLSWVRTRVVSRGPDGQGLPAFRLVEQAMRN